MLDRLLSSEGHVTVIAANVEREKTPAENHERDRDEIAYPFEAGAKAMRVDSEAAQDEANLPPEIAHEIQAAIEQHEGVQPEREG